MGSNGACHNRRIIRNVIESRFSRVNDLFVLLIVFTVLLGTFVRPPSLPQPFATGYDLQP